MEALAKLFNYKIDSTDRAELEFLWNMMDVNGDKTLSKAECKKVLEATPLTNKINAWA